MKITHKMDKKTAQDFGKHLYKISFLIEEQNEQMARAWAEDSISTGIPFKRASVGVEEIR